MKISLPSIVCLCILGLITASSCLPQEYTAHGGPFGYRLDAPDTSYRLAADLQEISGLSWLEEGRLLCIQDEKALLYTFDLASGSVTGKTDFGQNKDYEGVEIVPGGDVWVLESDGDLYRFAYGSKEKTEAEKYETDLSSDNDVEGLGYVPATHQLLLACKADAEHKDSKNYKGKAIYAFDIGEEKLREEPVLIIEDSKMATFLNEDADRAVEFNPSAIAWHPTEHLFYILSSAGKKLVVADSEGDIKQLIYLPAAMFPQPEGICFAPDGTMFIANEGKAGRATILIFKYKPPKNTEK